MVIMWCEDNDFGVNRKKCHIITFTRKVSPIIYDYKIGDETIDRVHQIRDLGVILDEKLNLNSHREFIISKSKSALQFVKRQSYFFDTDITKILYMTLVRSNLEFASSIWSPYHVTHKLTIESVQKQIVIYLNGDHLNRGENGSYSLAPYTERCTKFELTTLVRRRINASVLFIHGLISGKIDAPHLRSQMTLNQGIRTLRNPEFIRIKLSKTKASTYSPFNNACHVYNHAVLFIDPTLPYYDFRERLQGLPDSSFGPWAKFLDVSHN